MVVNGSGPHPGIGMPLYNRNYIFANGIRITTKQKKRLQTYVSLSTANLACNNNQYIAICLLPTMNV